jgi:hypothetical protein
MKNVISINLLLPSLIFSLAAALPANAETLQECIDKTLTRGSERSQNSELSKRCEKTWENYDECKAAVKLVRQAILAQQEAIRDTCAKQVSAGDDSKSQNGDIAKAGAKAAEGKATTQAAEAKLNATNAVATKGKDKSEQAIKLVIDDPNKMKPEKRGIVQKIVNDFKGSDYDTVADLASYLKALKRIDDAWASLQKNPDLSNDKYNDTYEATATYLNAEEVRLGSSYQKNQMTAASSAFQMKTDTNNSNSSGFGDSSKDSKSGFGNLGMLTSAAGAAGALSGLAKSGSTSAAGLDTGASTISAGTTPGSTLAGGANLNGSNSLDNAPAFNAGTGNPERSAASLGTTAPNGVESGIGAGTSASKLDTSLRDSLKGKLANSGASGGSEQLAADSKAAVAEAKAALAKGTIVLDDKGVPIVASTGPTDAVDFKMKPGETDDAVNDLLAGFKDQDKNEAGNLGTMDEASGRKLASVDESTAGIEGSNSSNLFTRVHSRMHRCVKKGCVTNGISNGKI